MQISGSAGPDAAEALAAVRAQHPPWPLTLAREVAARRLGRTLAEEALPGPRVTPPAALLRALACPAIANPPQAEPHASGHTCDATVQPGSADGTRVTP
jgi:hypothetical protein